MQAKTNPKRRRLVALFATILAIVGAFALAAKPALAAADNTLEIIKVVSGETDSTTKFKFTVELGTAGNAVGKLNNSGENLQFTSNKLEVECKRTTS